ncbi:MAG: transposase [Rhodocyclaceae bacterium]|nr:transposase [Rhodocyclaceae bacterium]
MSRPTKFSPEVQERAVRLVLEHQGEHESQWAAIRSVASKTGCTPESLRRWVRRAGVDQGKRPGVTGAEAQRVKELEREVKATSPRNQ